MITTTRTWQSSHGCRLATSNCGLPKTLPYTSPPSLSHKNPRSDVLLAAQGLMQSWAPTGSVSHMAQCDQLGQTPVGLAQGPQELVFAQLVRHARRLVLQLAEVAVPRAPKAWAAEPENYFARPPPTEGRRAKRPKPRRYCNEELNIEMIPLIACLAPILLRPRTRPVN